MSEFARKFDKALMAFGYPMGALAYDVATMPLPPDGDFDELLRLMVGEQTEGQ